MAMITSTWSRLSRPRSYGSANVTNESCFQIRKSFALQFSACLATLIKCESMLSWSAAILSKALQTARTRLATSDWGEFMITIDLSGKLKKVKTSAAVEQALTVGRLRSLQAGWLWAAPAILTESKVDECGCRNQQGRWMWLQKPS